MISMDKKPAGWTKGKKLVMGIGFAVLTLGTGVLIDRVTRDDEPKQPVKVAAKTSATVTRQGVPVDAALDALFRQLRARTICYEPERSTFLVLFVDNEELGEWADHWYLLSPPAFHHVPANGTYFLEEIPTKDYTRVWPDTSQLYCKTDSAAK